MVVFFSVVLIALVVQHFHGSNVNSSSSSAGNTPTELNKADIIFSSLNIQ
jgi:hypothetical protein